MERKGLVLRPPGGRRSGIGPQAGLHSVAVNELPVLSPACPAAFPIAGPAGQGPSIVCRVMEAEQRGADSILEGVEKGILNTLREDRAVVANFCCGDALPVTGEGDPDVEERHAHYTNCVVWQELRKAQLARQRFDLTTERPRESAVPGVGPEDPTEREVDSIMDERMSEAERARVRMDG